MSSLFREEAIDAQRVDWLGEVKVRRPRSFSAIVAISMALLTALLAFGYFGESSRKSRMTGIVVPVGGVLQVTATQAGVVAELSMLEGAVFGGVPLANGAQVAKAIWTFNGLLAVRAGGAVASYYTNPSSGTVTVSDISFYDEAGNFINAQHVEGSSGPVSGGGGDGGGGGGIATGGGGGGGGTVTVSDPVPVEDSPEQTNPG